MRRAIESAGQFSQCRIGASQLDLPGSRPLAPCKDVTVDSVSRTPSHWCERGFNLIELICTLVILGILASSVIPRFISLGEAAHQAVVAATTGAFGSALSLVHTACFVRGWASQDNLPGYGSGNVDFNQTCYPTDTTGNANTIASNNNRCLRVWNAILTDAPTVTTGTSGADYRARANNNVCTYQYLRDTSVARQFTYDSRNGLIVPSNP